MLVECLLFGVCVLVVVWWLLLCVVSVGVCLFVGCLFLCVACWLVFVACCVLVVVCSLMFVACC